MEHPSDSEFKELYRSLIEIVSSGQPVTARDTLLWDAFLGGFGDYDVATRIVPPETIVGLRKKSDVSLSTVKLDVRVDVFNEAAGMTSQDSMWRKENGAVLLANIRLISQDNESTDKKPHIWGGFHIWSDSEVEHFLEFEPCEENETQHGDDVFQFLQDLGYKEAVIDQARVGQGVSSDGSLESVEVLKFRTILLALFQTNS